MASRYALYSRDDAVKLIQAIADEKAGILTWLRLPLVERYIDAGSELVRLLDEKNFDVSAAYWLLPPDSSDWRLIIATSLLETVDSREVYTRLQALIPADSYIKLWDIQLVRPDNNVVKALSKYLSHGLRTVPLRVDGVPIADQFFEDAWVYRVSALAPQS